MSNGSGAIYLCADLNESTAAESEGSEPLQVSFPLLRKVHLAHDVDMRHFEVDHTAHGGHNTGKVLCSVVHELRFEEVGRAESDVVLL